MLSGIINLDKPPRLPQGLGIELSENSNIHAHDNGTTFGVDGDSNFERRREMVNMRSPDFYVKQSGCSGTTSQRRKSKEHKHQSHPVESTKYMVDAVHSRHKKEMQNTMDLLDGKIERLVAAQSRYEGVLNNTRDSIDQIIAEQRKIREIMDAMLFENRKTRKTMATQQQRAGKRLMSCWPLSAFATTTTYDFMSCG